VASAPTRPTSPASGSRLALAAAGAPPAAAQPVAVADGHRPWLARPRRLALSSLFLVYLTYVAIDVAQFSHGGREVVGFVLLAAFCGVYLYISERGARLLGTGFVVSMALLFALFCGELAIARAAAFVMCLHITAILVARLGSRSWPLVVALALAALLLPLAVPSWHYSIGDDFDMVTPVAIPVVAFVSWGLQQIVTANFALAQARADLARLTAENERARIARDLHDLLGHSLTTITVKAGLAHRLGEFDVEAALREIAEVEQLSRRSLHDVRAAVANYREVTLTGELATGHELLRAAGIDAELPTAVDIVDPCHQELLGWVVREGLTNVVRHSHATWCAVRLTAAGVEVLDDGIGPADGPLMKGSGLSGLRERVGAAGGTLETGPRQPRGWSLCVTLDPNGR
jgi:two-component system sensor histidine kinase DesK